MSKRPYVIKLEKKSYLYGMRESKKWILLANATETTKITNKMALEMAVNLGMDGAPQSKWCDLYLNGVYQGNYLICEKIESALIETSVTKPEDITGTYMIEKDIERQDTLNENHFFTEDGNMFIFKDPEILTQEQNKYITEYVQMVEDKIINQEVDLFNYLDIESLALQYFVDEITGNADMFITSLYFYKKQNDEKLYTGPVWDYDRTLGYFDWIIYDSDKEMSEYRGDEMLTWLSYLETNEEFVDYCGKFYEEYVRPYVIELINSGIDTYAKENEKSYMMDQIAGVDRKYFYSSYDGNVRYIKYYLCQRLEMFDKKYNINLDKVEFEGNNTVHTVTFIYGDETITYEVMDGQTISAPFEVDPLLYLGWFESNSYIGYNDKMPVLEDMTIEALD